MNEGLYPIGRQPAALAMRLRAFNKLLSGTGTYTPRPGTKLLRVRKWGGGGGSGGSLAAAWGYAASSNGSDGQYTEEWVTHTPGATYAYAIGAGGTAGTSAPTNGGDGGDTTFAGTTTAKGGTGGASNYGSSSQGGLVFAPSRSGPGAGAIGVGSYNTSAVAGQAGQAGLIQIEEY